MKTTWIPGLLLALLALNALADDHGGYREESSRGGKNLPAVSNARWAKECAACHLAFHPGLLPQASWKRMMGGLDKHFGTDASLDDASVREITDFLVKNSADVSSSRRSTKIVRSLGADPAPLRFTETPYFVREHREVAASTWKNPKIGSPANCAACHTTAQQGDFSERNIRMP